VDLSFKQFKLGVKIGSGYTAVAGILVLAVSISIFQVGRTTRVTNRVIDLRAPTAQASLGMMNGMNHSLASLRGWMLLGNEAFKKDRTDAWENEINVSMTELKRLSVEWTDPVNIQRLKVIESRLNDFKKFQQEIEDIAQTTDNTPATRILLEQAAPRAEVLAQRITQIIDIELTLEGTSQRKKILGMMADIRGTTGLAIANIRGFLLSGNSKFRQAFLKLWEKNTRRFKDLSANSRFLTSEQSKAFKIFSATRVEFEKLPPQMFKIRGSSEWNLANAWLSTKAAPVAAVIVKELDGMIKIKKL
jgi:methyl-accepting chemotaxis protein